MYYIAISFIIIAVFGVLSGCLFYKYRNLNRKLAEEFIQNPHFAEPNNDGKDLSFTTFNGFGHSLQGKFRKATIDGHLSYVSYRCRQIGLFAIFPDECLRIIPAKRGRFYILGSDVDDTRETTCIKYRFYAIVSLLPALLSLTFMLILAPIFM